MTGIMQLSPAAVTGPGVASLKPGLDTIPDFGWTRRWEAYSLAGDFGAAAGPWRDGIAGALMAPVSAPLLVQDGSILAVEFDGLDDYYNGPTMTRAQPYTVVAVAKPLSVNAGAHTVVGGGGSSQRGAIFQDAVAWRMNAGIAFSNPGSASVAGYQIITAAVNGTSSILRVNGVETAGSGGTDTATIWTVGGLTGPSSFFHGRIAAVFYAPLLLDATQRATMESTLRALYPA